MWEASSISHTWYIVRLVLFPERRTCKRTSLFHRSGQRTFLPLLQTSANQSQSQRMTDQSWDLNLDPLCSYEMLKGYLPLYRRTKRQPLFCLGVMQFPCPVIKLHFTALPWLELSPTILIAFSVQPVSRCASVEVNSNFKTSFRT